MALPVRKAAATIADSEPAAKPRGDLAAGRRPDLPAAGPRSISRGGRAAGGAARPSFAADDPVGRPAPAPEARCALRRQPASRRGFAHLTDIAPPEPGPPAGAVPAPWRGRRAATALIVIAAALLLFAGAMTRSFYDGRLAAPMTHDDVNHFVHGIQHLVLLRGKGVWALVAEFRHSSPHAPFSNYQAMTAFLLFGIADWAPYASNFAFVLLFFGFAAYLLRDCPPAVTAAAMACLIALPLSSNLAVEFGPEPAFSLFTAIGAALMVRLPVIEAPIGARLVAALFFTLGFLAHPSAFPFTLIALFGAAGVAFARDVIWGGRFKALADAIICAALNVLLAVLLPALYMIPRRGEYAGYFYNAVFNPAMRQIWNRGGMPPSAHFNFYLFGDGGLSMFDHKLPACAVIIGLGFAASWRQRDRRLLARQAEYLPLAVLFWLVPTLSAAKQYLFASTFGFAVAILTVMALGAIHQAIRGRAGIAAVSAIGALMFAAYMPANLKIPNVPATALDREFAFAAIERFKAVLLGNAANAGHAQVYMTNMGAYAPNMLQYYLLKTDPALEWKFDSKWTDPDPRRHLDFIHGWPADFVIAGARGNGLTYSPFAEPAEDTVLAALWRDPGYFAIDRFTGSGGRDIVIFARRGNFAGWRAISGLSEPSAADGPRQAASGLAYLQTYGSRAVKADLQIDWAGATAGQKLGILVNRQKAAELTYQAGTAAPPELEISLAAGNNDIVLQSDGPLILNRLLVVPRIGGAPDQAVQRR